MVHYANSRKYFILSSILLFVSIFASKILYKIGVPTLILFLVVGMLAGSDGIGKKSIFMILK